MILLVLGVGLLWLGVRAWRQSGLPTGRVVYSDTRGWQATPQPLLSRRYGLVGKPDYIVEEGGAWTPVEVKPTRRAATPYLSDILQLAAYCLLIEDVWGQAPRRGLLRYAEQTFAVDYTPDLKAVLLDTLAEMRVQRHARDVPRDHDEPGRCAACGLRAHCDQRLV